MAQKIINLLKKGCALALFLSILFFTHSSFAGTKGSISIIIDDMGYDYYVMQKFLEIDLPIAFSFIPDTPFDYMSNDFCKKGYTVMLHMPSESVTKSLNVNYALLLRVSDSKEEIFDKLNKALKSIPCASGFNNHMGSMFLQSEEKMTDTMEFLKQHNLFFVDSLTSPNSVGYKVACKYHVDYAVRDMFIDNKKRINYVKQNLLDAIKLAKQGKNVILIGHENIINYEAIIHLKGKLKPYLRDIKENLKQCQ
ncbi:MAG TPA: divergent polysaccharide deacetylase family protein [Desulfurella acetivorans]|uniref:Divergent polysaccharide deacetylase family protein n=1 Tax=Desulfurella acetivorans TaxID=33002 RepID=A0A7C6E7Y0_DESAE|nr:divergent polysaccharide deacetylase family protein [Desulfurella acetivorans]